MFKLTIHNDVKSYLDMLKENQYINKDYNLYMQHIIFLLRL